MGKQEIEKLLNRYLAGECTAEEAAWIETWYNRDEAEELRSLPPNVIRRNLDEVFNRLPKQTNVRRLTFLRGAAAIIVILMAVGAYFYLESPFDLPRGMQSTSDLTKNEIPPGGNKAMLTLDDGTTISLDDADSGKIAEQNGIRISKTQDGLLAYAVIEAPAAQNEAPKFNTVHTPKGGQYQIVLPDQTRVWLNAASSLKYPTNFNGNERKVELTGEGYFEVTSMENVPFKVVSGGQVVEVLGTRFNINSYSDEPIIRTTLVEGSVKVSENSSNSSTILDPGEQARLANNEFSVHRVNIANEIAWKSGLFKFDGADIGTVMRQVARWYDVEVEFEEGVPDIQLWGEIARDVDAAQVLEMLKYFDLKYNIVQSNAKKKIIIY